MCLWRAVWVCWAGWFLLASSAGTSAQLLTPVFSAETDPLHAGQRVSLWLNVLNSSGTPLAWRFPERPACLVKTGSGSFERELQLEASSSATPGSIEPGTFARARYWLDLPAEALGQVILEFPALHAGALAVQVKRPPPADTAKRKETNPLKSGEPAPPDKPFDPAHYFKEQLSPYEPFYFVAGPESPNAKFQFSFKYQLLSGEAPLADKAPWLKGFAFAFTQTSLWDWNQASAPFLDSSYKPELLYAWKDVYRDEDSTFRLDLQPGFQHESNGKGGEDSRSLNRVYLRSTLVFGKPDHLQLTLQPRAWFYVGDLSDNPDIARYYGYVDLRGILGWERGIQLSAIGRMGDEADKGSVQLDLTYPLMRLWRSFSVYADLQFFTGYGESLLLYDQRSWAVRAGFALYR